jgi:hypothetical protein
MYSTRCSRQILIILEFSQQIFGKYSNIQFHENLSSDSRVVSCGRKDGQMIKLTLAFFNFTIAYQKASVTVVVRISGDAWGLMKRAGMSQPVYSNNRMKTC